MRVGLNLLYLLPGIVGGTETYAAGLLQGFAALASGDEFVVFVNREAADWLLPSGPRFKRVVCPVLASSRPRRYAFEQIGLPRLLRQQRIDLVHSLGYVGPVLSPCPSVVTIPDLNYIDQARTFSLHRRLVLRFVSTQAARTADAIVTISDFSKKRLCETLGLPVDKITVTHLAPRPELDVLSAESWPELRQRYGIREPYVVAFGGGAVHKNIAALLQAFDSLTDRMPHSLVLIGHLPPDLRFPTAGGRKGPDDRVIAIGYVPGAQIGPLLHHAELFVLPSLYEGFGLPVLEAQQAGVAVVCSTAGSLPEVAGDAAIYFDPLSVADMAVKVILVAQNKALQDHLRELGRRNLARFSWTQAARKTLDVYQEAITASRRR